MNRMPERCSDTDVGTEENPTCFERNTQSGALQS